MTRIFGYVTQKEIFGKKDSERELIQQSVERVFDNLAEAVAKTYEIDRFPYGLGFIVAKDGVVKGYSVQNREEGIAPGSNIADLLPDELKHALKNNPDVFFAVLQQSFSKNPQEAMKPFPLESENWYVMTMGWWSNGNFNDQELTWYSKERPAMSIANYLETNPENPDFSWVDKRRTPYIIAVKKDCSAIIVDDRYSRQNDKGYGFVYSMPFSPNIIHNDGVRDPEGQQV